MNGNLSTLRRMFQPARQRTIRNKHHFRPRVEALETRLAPANVPILSGHFDSLLSGSNSQETALNPTTLNDAGFGKLFNYSVDGYTYAQPLYVPNLTIPGQGGGTYNVVFSATEHDSLYAFNADAQTGGPANDGLLWKRSFIDPANGIDTMPAVDTFSSDIVPEVGITGTPVIDPATNTLYVIAKTKEIRQADPANAHYVQKLYAIDITTGNIRASSGIVTIGDSAYVNGTNTFVSNTTDISVPGTGAGSQGGILKFDARKESDRMSSQIVNGTVYLAYASHGDNGPYHGWILGYKASDLSLQKVFNTSPNGSASGIWESGGNLGFDDQGNLYFSTGNGFGTGFNFNSGGPTALGALGGGLGYQGIGNSVSVRFRNLPTQTGLGTNGNFGANVDLPGFDFNAAAQAGDTFNVSLSYDATLKKLTETITNTNHPTQTFTTTYDIDIPATVGGTSAYVGFTGGTSGQNAEQDIKTWLFTPATGTGVNHGSGFASSSDLTANGGASLPPYTAPSSVGTFQYHQDLGIPGDPVPAGTAAYDPAVNGGTYTLTASGTDIGFKANQYDTDTDRMQFVYNAVSGTSGEIIARVHSLTNTDFWTKAVVQIRQSLDPQAANAESVLSPHNVSEMTWRNNPPSIDNAGNQAPGLTGAQERGTGTAPLPDVWIRLVRAGNTFKSFWAVDTVDGSGNHVPGAWQGEIDHDVAMTGDVYVGIGLCAHANGKTATAAFDHVSVTGFTARTQDPVAILTPNANNQSSSIFANNKVDISGNWTTSFTFQLKAGSNPIADGMTFTIQNAARGTEMSESVIKLSTTGPGTSMPVVDYFTPHDWKLLDNQDADLGSGGTLLLPDAVSGGKHLMVETGKTGRLYLLDRDNLGQFNTRYDHIVQIVDLGGVNQTPGVWGNPAFFQDGPNTGLLYYWGSSAPGQSFRITNGVITAAPVTMTTTSPTPVPGRPTDGRSNFPGTQPSISSNGTDGSSGIMWALRSDGYGINGTEVLYAYSAEDLTHLLWSSTDVKARDEIGGSSVKFTMPIVSNGHVYAGANGTLAVYGLLTDHANIPANPANLHVTQVDPLAGGDTKLQLSWDPQTDATLFKIERTATLDNAAQTAAIAAGGTGYAVNDTITLAGGTSTQATVLKVTTVGAGGAITQVSIMTPGRYSATPPDPVAQASTSGTGSEATFNMTWSPPFTQVAEVAGNQNTYTDTGLTPLTHYWYRTRATNQAGDSTNYSIVSEAFTHLAGAKLVLTNVASKDVDLSWNAVLASNSGNHYDVERSSDNFATNTITVGSNLPPSQTSFADTTVDPGNTYYYRVHAFNTNPAPSDESFSNVVIATTSPVDIESPFPDGFQNVNGLQFNGSASFSPTEHLIRLTDDIIQASSVFTNNRVDVSKFNTTFWVRMHEGTQPTPADGFTFTIQANSPAALGSAANGLGYAGIGKSVAIKFAFFNGGAANQTGLYTNGQGPTTNNININPSIVNLGDQHRKRIDISYDASTLQLNVTITDEQHDGGPTSVSQSYTVDIPGIVGGGAYVGFTGGTGGFSVNGTGALYTLEDITGWVFPPTAPAAPDNLTATLNPPSFSDVTLNWKDHATSEDGYTIERSPDNYHFDLLDTLGVGANSYHDTTVASNSVYFYRIQAFNSLGRSAYTTLQVTNAPPAVSIDHSNGFASHNDLQANGNTAYIDPAPAAGTIGTFTAHQDIFRTGETPGTPGTATFDSATNSYTLTASGSDIWDDGDRFHYLYKPMNGDGEIIARVVNINNTDFWSKGGIMIRDTLNANSMNAFMFETGPNNIGGAGAHNEPVFQWRDSTGGSSGDFGNHVNNLQTAPVWLRLVRSGNVFSGYWAQDINNGQSHGPWNNIGANTHTVPMGASVFVGLGLTAHNNSTNASAKFDHVTIVTAARLTDTQNNQNSSLFTTQQVPITGGFTTSWVMNMRPNSGSSNAADGVTFTIQNDAAGAAAIGQGGGGLGYASDTVGGAQGIHPSVMVKFDMYSQGSHHATTGLYINGESPNTLSKQVDMNGAGIDFTQNHTYQVDLVYDGLTLNETVKDLISGKTFTTSYSIGIRDTIGSDFAYVGFTGGTGGQNAWQAIESWTASFIPVAAPLHLEAHYASATSGAPTIFTVSAKTASGANVSSYRGTIHFSSNDPQAILPDDYTFTASDNGTHSFAGVLFHVGTDTITVTDDSPTPFTDTTSILINPKTFTLAGFPTTTTAGVEQSFTVTALDYFNNVAADYQRKVHFNSDDPQAVLPADTTLTGGTGTFTATLKTAGTHFLAVRDPLTPGSAHTGTESDILVNPGPLSSFILAGFPSPTQAGVAHNLTVTAKDAYGNTITGYSGTVHFTSTGGSADFPDLFADNDGTPLSGNSYTFVADDAGTHVFNVTLFKAGTARSITVTDSSIATTLDPIVVKASNVMSYLVDVPLHTGVMAGVATPVIISAVDTYGNTGAIVTGTTIHFSSTDTTATFANSNGMPLPGGDSYTFTDGDNGTHMFMVTFRTTGTHTLSVTDDLGLTGLEDDITVV
jgi:hypothetical protein